MLERIETIKSELLGLDVQNSQLFLLSVVLKLFGNYKLFFVETQTGDVDGLQEIVDKYRTFLLKGADAGVIESLLSEMEEKAPEPGDFDTILASSALDFCSVLIEALSFLKVNASEHVSNAVDLCVDSIHMYVQERDDYSYGDIDKMNQGIYSDPLMVRDIGHMEAVIEFLKSENAELVKKIERLEELVKKDFPKGCTLL